VELKSLTEADFIRILKEPKGALVKQYIALLDTEGIKLNLHRRCHRTDCRVRGARQPNVGEHWGAALAHHHGKIAGGNFVRRPDLKKKNVRSTRCTSASNWRIL